jgi:hypothetical protein
MNVNVQPPASLPWYRHRWPWFLMAGPAIVVVASLYTAWLAVRTSDGLVTEDYYRKGLAINQTLKLSERASELGLEAGVSVSLERIGVRLSSRQPGFVLPDRLHVTVSHPTRAGFDQSQWVHRQGGGYIGQFRLPADGHWVMLIEDEAQSWRIMGNLILPALHETVFGEPTSRPR